MLALYGKRRLDCVVQVLVECDVLESISSVFVSGLPSIFLCYFALQSRLACRPHLHTYRHTHTHDGRGVGKGLLARVLHNGTGSIGMAASTVGHKDHVGHSMFNGVDEPARCEEYAAIADASVRS